MILECLGAALIAVLIILSGYLVLLGAENREKYKFFEKNAPGLKVLKDPSLFGGHSNNVIHAKYNCALADQLFQEYGPTVGLFFDSRPAVLTKDLDFIKTFTVDEKDHINRMRANIPWSEVEDDCIMFAEDEQWVRIRKAIAPAFSAHKIRSPYVQSEINSVIEKFVNAIEQKLEKSLPECCAEVDIGDLCHRFALAIVFSSFYKQEDVIDFTSDSDKNVEMLENTTRNMIGFFVRACAAFPVLKSPINWLILNFGPQGFVRQQIMDFIREQTRLNFEAFEQAKDFGKTNRTSCHKGDEFDANNFTLKDGSRFRRNMIDYIIDRYREGTLTKSEYYNSTFFLFFAANTTTSDTISRCLYNLANNLEAQEKLRASVLVSGTDSEYLSWVVNESLRLNPPAPIGCSRVIKRDIQTKYGLVPAGTFVVTPAFTIGRLKEYWGEDADEFRPERWADAKSFHPVQFWAFGAGRRACPGRELALMEIKMLLSTLIRGYKFEKSLRYPEDNSKHFAAPIYVFLVFDTPTYVRVSRLTS